MSFAEAMRRLGWDYENPKMDCKSNSIIFALLQNRFDWLGREVKLPCGLVVLRPRRRNSEPTVLESSIEDAIVLDAQSRLGGSYPPGNPVPPLNSKHHEKIWRLFRGML